MNVRQERAFRHRKELKRAGWDVPKADGIRFNSGSESLSHVLAKSTIAWVLKQDGYRIASEVSKEGAGEIDLIAYGTEDLPVAIECETDWQDDVLESKLERYVKHEPLRDIFPVEVTTMPSVNELRAWAENQV